MKVHLNKNHAELQEQSKEEGESPVTPKHILLTKYLLAQQHPVLSRFYLDRLYTHWLRRTSSNCLSALAIKVVVANYELYNPLRIV